MSWYEPDDGISFSDWDKVCERAIEYATDPDKVDEPLVLPEGVPDTEIIVDDISNAETMEGWDLRCTYGDRSVVVFVSSDILLPDEDDYV